MFAVATLVILGTATAMSVQLRRPSDEVVPAREPGKREMDSSKCWNTYRCLAGNRAQRDIKPVSGKYGRFVIGSLDHLLRGIQFDHDT